MSMIRCEQCERLIDSDDDPECFVEVGNMRRLHKEVVWCEWCREKHDAEQDAMDQMVAEAEANADQARAAASP